MCVCHALVSDIISHTALLPYTIFFGWSYFPELFRQITPYLPELFGTIPANNTLFATTFFLFFRISGASELAEGSTFKITLQRMCYLHMCYCTEMLSLFSLFYFCFPFKYFLFVSFFLKILKDFLTELLPDKILNDSWLKKRKIAVNQEKNQKFCGIS